MSVYKRESTGLEAKIRAVPKHAIPRKWRENPKGNKEIWESREMSLSSFLSHRLFIIRILFLYFVLLMKSHLQSYPCPLQINTFWNLGFLLGITIILQIITGIFLGLHYTSDLNNAYSSIFFFIREIFYGNHLLLGLQIYSFHQLSFSNAGKKIPMFGYSQAGVILRL